MWGDAATGGASAPSFGSGSASASSSGTALSAFSATTGSSIPMTRPVSPISSAALFRLNYLYSDGAKISLMSEHAPAFFSLQMNEARLSVPQIVMDGAAIYDANENEYLHVETLGENNASLLRKRLDELGASYFVYTVRKNKTCVFHHGPLSEQERLIYDRMRRSPYRSYLEEEHYEPGEVVYYKIIADEPAVTRLQGQLQSFLYARRLRAVRRSEAGAEGLSALYIYGAKANMRQAEERVMQMLQKENSALRPAEVFLRDGYHSEHDAMSLLHTLGNSYEPLRLFPKRKKA